MLLLDERFEDDADELDDAEETEETEKTADDDALGGRKFGWIYGMRRRMRELLALPAPDGDERTYLIEMGVPSEDIDNCMLLMGVLFRLALEGNMRAFQELRHIVGDNETNLDRRMKLAQLKKTRAQIDDMKRKLAENDGSGGEGAALLCEALEESAASLWQNGGED